MSTIFWCIKYCCISNLNDFIVLNCLYILSNKNFKNRKKKKKKEQDMEQQTGAKLGKEYIKAIYCHPVFLTYMQRTSSKMPGWMKHNLESRNITNLIYADDTSFMAESEEELNSPLMKVKEESEKLA